MLVEDSEAGVDERGDVQHLGPERRAGPADEAHREIVAHGQRVLHPVGQRRVGSAEGGLADRTGEGYGGIHRTGNARFDPDRSGYLPGTGCPGSLKRPADCIRGKPGSSGPKKGFDTIRRNLYQYPHKSSLIR